MLCKDMFTMEPTTDATSRVYASTPAPAPPASLTSKFSVIAEAPPSPPPTSALHRPTQQIGSGSHLGRAPSSGGGRVGAHCEFEEGIEYVLDVTAGYDDRTAPSMEGCCDLCSAQPTCTRFVFEKSTGTCVSLAFSFPASAPPRGSAAVASAASCAKRLFCPCPCPQMRFASQCLSLIHI